MATLYTVLSALQEQLAGLTAGLVSVASDTSGDPLNVEVGIGWPSERTLQNNVRKSTTPTALIAVVDRGMATDTTRWLPYVVSRNVVTETVQAALSGPILQPGGTATLTISGTVTTGDAVALLATAVRGTAFGDVTIANAGDTPASLATALAGVLNADQGMTTLLTATASGGVVTLASLQTSPVSLQCNVGNGGSAEMEVGRRSRGLQVILWTRTEDDLIVIGDILEVAIAQMEADFGLTFPDGTMGRLKFAGDHQLYDATLADTYRRDFLVSVDYGITTTDQLFAVLAPIPRNTVF